MLCCCSCHAAGAAAAVAAAAAAAAATSTMRVAVIGAGCLAGSWPTTEYRYGTSSSISAVSSENLHAIIISVSSFSCLWVLYV